MVYYSTGSKGRCCWILATPPSVVLLLWWLQFDSPVHSFEEGVGELEVENARFLFSVFK